MTISDVLPDRPLTFEEVESLDKAGPYSGRPMLNQVFAIMFVTDSTTYALGYDDDGDGWIVIEAVPTDDGGEATDAIDTAVNEWVEDTYADEYGNVQFEV